MRIIRTIGPLHLEDLEPHRFEDLIRQLAYDFRRWASLEATGRLGSDDGFDARAIEVNGPEDYENNLSEEDAPSEISLKEERVWLIQCKREKTITPKKLQEYIEQISTSGEPLYGMLFASACDFSKKARDTFREKTRELHISEAYLWGKAEIEDFLFQPKNDHLLFAYFGFSLQVRQRSLRTTIRARLANKRKAIAALSDYEPILIRDATDDRYPYLDRDKHAARLARGRWSVMSYMGSFADGLHFLFHRHFAFLGDDGEEWD